MGYVTKEQITRAKEVPILEYVLANEPENVKKIGSEYRLKDHSVTMSNGKWHWHSHGVGGEKATALNYLITVRGFSFVDAVEQLAGVDYQIYDISNKTNHSERNPFSLPKRNISNYRVIEYLQGRGIETPLIIDCIKRSLLYESATYHNCVFLGRDDKGKARFAAMRGTMGDFKCDADGSDKKYGFALPPSDTNSDTVAVFESPIDVLSHACLFPDIDCWRLSLGGTALAALTNFLDRHSGIRNCVVCTDNDKAGNTAAAKIAEISSIAVTRDIPPFGKDWNETLISTRNEVKKLQDERQNIRFIDSGYNTLFTIKDGDSIKLTSGYDGEVKNLKCRHIDETHTVIGNNTYHICEFAEIVERNGHIYEPMTDQKPMLNVIAAKYGEPLRDTEIPMTEAAIEQLVGGKYDKDLLYYESGKAAAALVRGSDGAAVFGIRNDTLTSLHPYTAQMYKRELGVIEKPPKESLLGKLDKGKEKAAEQKNIISGDVPKKNHTAERG